MTFFLEFKEKLKSFYTKSSVYLNPVLKFGLALVVFININMMLGFLPQLNSVFVVLILALLCAILPITAIMVFGCFLIVGHCYAVGIEVAAFALVLLLLLMILYLRFSRRDALALVLTPLAFQLQIPCALPIAYGLTGNAGSCVSVSCGAVLYYFMRLVSDKAVLLQDGEIKELAQRLTTLLDGLVQNQEMWMTVITFIAVTLVVFCIRRASADYAWTIAIFSGGVLYLILMIIGGFFLDMAGSIAVLIAGTAVSVILLLILEFFVFNVDYSRAEYLQYEDDEYYYYVKAIPKMRISRPERSVKTIEADNDIPENLEDKLEKSLKDIHIH
ncbi:hypothetical protein [Ruminococcus gauvreauii]|uniref:ABC transporter permease n=1 Tax=Ruminococcus gauvreauii TaxID=438033 RepID=A0ABY5VEN4_9FIRM|nr:hypothetical protein [Ruminococcus gauvreauii]UWP58386.1 hypothetical protein NQ502_13465 [Ruminococcus gauvreauii]